MKIAIGCDHAGFDLKESLKSFLLEKDFEIEDVGCFSKERCDYPQYSEAVVKLVSNQGMKGLLICGSGIGVSIVANKFKGIRAALVRSVEEAKLSRQHNDSNVICLGARITSADDACEIIAAWLNEKFEEGRHEERLKLFSNRGETFQP